MAAPKIENADSNYRYVWVRRDPVSVDLVKSKGGEVCQTEKAGSADGTTSIYGDCILMRIHKDVDAEEARREKALRRAYDEGQIESFYESAEAVNSEAGRQVVRALSGDINELIERAEYQPRRDRRR
jgi:hypothetical protein